MLYKASYTSIVGTIELFSDGISLTGLFLPKQRKNIIEEPLDGSGLFIIQQTRTWLDLYFSGHNPSFSPHLSFSGTPFQHKVWQILKTIPYGQVVTYGEIARLLAKDSPSQKMSAQAVGQAVSANPISIIIPCHRVIGARQNLTGYAGGLDAKRTLLKIEGVSIL